ncbi:Uncharacterised protein [Leminorella grimontii]|nr:Uncharacterised protein [Leminorella grimontii]
MNSLIYTPFIFLEKITSSLLISAPAIRSFRIFMLISLYGQLSFF